MSRLRRSWRFLGAGVALLGVLHLASCRSAVERRDPTGERFPEVTGQSLSGETLTFPVGFAGSPLLVIVGYEQNSQFDIDRWLLGLDQAGVQVRVVEMPTLPGLGARMASGYIDAGMRSGIPSEDWKSVVCVYADAQKVVDFTGNENPLPGRVLLLDSEGTVVFFHDRGYSVGSLKKLREALDGIR